jgi:hypothetical protein
MRRAIGIGGATFVAVGAALVLTLPASAHNHTDSASCVDGKSVLNVQLTNYGDKPNSVTITETDGNGKVTVLHSDKDFTPKYTPPTFIEDGTITQSYHVVVVANTKQFSFDHTDTTPACVTTTTTTTVPPTTTTAPPTTTKVTATVTTTTSPAATTTTAVVAAATTTGSGTLPFTGVNATFPLLIAGVLVVAGGGILLWLRLAARRRRTNG